MIRILELDSSKGWGGQEIRTVRLINGMDKNKFEIFYAVQPDSTLFQKRNEIHATCIPISIRKSYDVVALWKLIQIIRHHKIDLICTHSGWDGWIGAIAGKLCGIKVIRYRHLQTPITSTISYNLSDRVVTDSEFIAKALIKAGVKEKKLHTIYSGVELENYSHRNIGKLRELLEIQPSTLLIGIVAVLRTAKRHIDLIEAFELFKKRNPSLDSHLVIIGTGPIHQYLEDIIKAKHLQYTITLLGHSDHVPTLIGDLDIFVLPSEMETFGMAIVEAAAAEVPSIVSNVGGMPEIVIHGKTGLIFPVYNTLALTESMEDLAFNPKKRKEMGKAARAYVTDRYSVKNMVEQTEHFYIQLLQE